MRTNPAGGPHKETTEPTIRRALYRADFALPESPAPKSEESVRDNLSFVPPAADSGVAKAVGTAVRLRH